MKKVFALFAIAAMVAVACSKDDDKKDDNKDKEKDPPKEYTGPEQGTSDWSVIGALLETNWDTDFVMAQSGDIYVLKNVKLTAADEFKVRFQKAWDVNRGDAFSELGKGFPVTQGGANVKPGLDGFYDIYYNAAVEQMAVVALNGTPTWSENTPPAGNSAIAIDGDFDDWAALEAGTFAKAINDPDSPWEAVKEIRCYADAETVFYYINYDKDCLQEQFDIEDDLPIRLCINTDGEFESGYTNYFLEGYDFIIEGALAEGGAWTIYDGTLHQRIDGSWTALLEPENGLVTGMGSGTQYEIALNRAKFNEAVSASSVPMPMGDEFQTGIRFYGNNWGELSNMPNSSIDEEQGNGWGYLLRIHTNK